MSSTLEHLNIREWNGEKGFSIIRKENFNILLKRMERESRQKFHKETLY
jgi:hypothetical protein